MKTRQRVWNAKGRRTPKRTKREDAKGAARCAKDFARRAFARLRVFVFQTLHQALGLADPVLRYDLPNGYACRRRQRNRV
jgi:hypothetical protein